MKPIVASRIASKTVEDLIESEDYHRPFGQSYTICTLRLKSGFIVIAGEGPVDADEFDEALGKKYAREAAIDSLYKHVAFCEKFLEHSGSLLADKGLTLSWAQHRGERVPVTVSTHDDSSYEVVTKVDDWGFLQADRITPASARWATLKEFGGYLKGVAKRLTSCGFDED